MFARFREIVELEKIRGKNSKDSGSSFLLLTRDRQTTIGIGADSNCLIPVSDTPSFAITRLPGFGIPIVEGMSVSLKCEVDSNPASTPIWQRGK